jgi:peptidoglycan/xylan/chitin deacetylase (PgdA/CDA1 family)
LLLIRQISVANNPKIKVFFTISIDTEQDVDKEYVHTGTYRNIKEGIPRLLDVFDDFKAQPTWLITPDVAQHCGYFFVNLAKRHEVGCHVHPEYFYGSMKGMKMAKILPQFSYQRQLEMLRETLYEIKQNVGVHPRSFRAGRFALNMDTLRALDSCGLNVDCSITPCFDWGFPAATLSCSAASARFIRVGAHDILEIPVTIVYPFGLFPAWLRPSASSGPDMTSVMKIRAESREDPLIFNMMFHSMELIDPNPYFASKTFFKNIRYALEYAYEHNVCFITMNDLYYRLNNLISSED